MGLLVTPPRGLVPAGADYQDQLKACPTHLGWKTCSSRSGPGHGMTGASSRQWVCPKDLKFCL